MELMPIISLSISTITALLLILNFSDKRKSDKTEELEKHIKAVKDEINSVKNDLKEHLKEEEENNRQLVKTLCSLQDKIQDNAISVSIHEERSLRVDKNLDAISDKLDRILDRD